MTYSVWNHATRSYIYYRTPEQREATNAPKPAHLRHATLGLAPEEAAWPLPADAVIIGAGKYPKGHIAVASAASPLSGFIEDYGIRNLALLGVAAWLLWKTVRVK